MIFAFGRIERQQADVRKVVRHLVDEARRAASPVHARELEVVLAECPRNLGSELAHRLRVVDAVGAIAVEPCGHAAYVGQLAGALDLGCGWRGSARAASIPSAAGPRMKIGAGSASPTPWRDSQELAVNTSDQPVVHRPPSAPGRSDLRALLRVARAVDSPRRARSRRGPRAPCRAQTGSSPRTAR